MRECAHARTQCVFIYVSIHAYVLVFLLLCYLHRVVGAEKEHEVFIRLSVCWCLSMAFLFWCLVFLFWCLLRVLVFIYLTEDTKAVLYYFTVFSLVFLVSCASSVCVCVLVLCSGVCVFVFNT